MSLTSLQREILTNTLRLAKKDPPEVQLEVAQVSLQTHYGLYQQEGNEVGMAIYRPLVELALQAQSIQELENSL